MVDLAKLIKNKPLVIPSYPKINEDLKSVIKGMLTPEIKKRIDWHDLFNHPITTYFSKKRKH
jgi:late competence protein required for DNA uptake (superfamily II DNA/RNA helicase)